ncbi:MAG: HlyD family secretion protein [Gemmataceae bacterium]
MKSLTWFSCALVLVSFGCRRSSVDSVQGYVEGEFVYVAAPSAGALEKLYVERGTQVKPGDLLFDLDKNPEQATRNEAEHKLAQAKANLEDARKGRRPTEIESLEAQLKQSRAALVLSETEFERQEKLLASGAGSREDFDKARAARDQDRQKVMQLEADLKTGHMGLRVDQIAAAEADVRAKESMLAKAEWDLAQKRQLATQAALVFDTLYRPGEWVAASKPVVVLLPPQNVKVRAFVSERRVGAISIGQEVRIRIDGTQPITGKVTFISPQAEYTPPVIYSRESRSKLVFLIEIRFDEPVAATLHPGQPVDVEISR